MSRNYLLFVRSKKTDATYERVYPMTYVALRGVLYKSFFFATVVPFAAGCVISQYGRFSDLFIASVRLLELALNGLLHSCLPLHWGGTAAVKLAEDFGIPYDNKKRVSICPHIREPTKEQMYQKDERYCYRVLTDYFHLLKVWETQYAPQQAEEEWHPLFVEALQRKSYIEYQIDILLNGSLEERKALVIKQKSEVRKIEQRIAEWSDDGTIYRRRSARQLGADTER